MRLRRRLLLLAAILAIASPVLGQEGPIRIVVGFPAGGESDVVARIIADGLRASLGVPVIVENKPGADGAIAAEALRNALPDGRTLMVSPIAVTVFAPLTRAKLPYDPVADFAPVSIAANFQMGLAVGPGSPARTIDEHIRWAAADRTRAICGVPLAGGPAHFFGAMLARAGGLDLAIVPYRGSAPLMADLTAGHVPAAITVVSQLRALHEAGTVRVLATSGAQRSLSLPGVPTFRELGFVEIEGSGWQGVHARAGTPPQVIGRLSAAIQATIVRRDVAERMVKLGLEPVGSTPDEMARRIADDVARWAPVIKASGFRADE